MISFDEAVAIIGSAVRPLGQETVKIDHAAGRILAQPVIAAIDSPREDVSSMDGYAVRGADLCAFPVSLKVVGESLPGVGWPGTVGPGMCARIFTGAPLPAGSDRVVIQEQVLRDDDVASIDADPGPATWVRARGKDFRAGDQVVPRGRLLNPAALIAAAGADIGEAEVYRRPRVFLLTTGDELAEPGNAREKTLAVPDSVSPGIRAFAEGWGAETVGRARLIDELETMKAKAREAVDAADLVVVVGGASVGERDFAKTMFEPLGLELLFSRISIRPGKPAWFGRISDKLVLGLPGNPTSALVTARLLMAPLLCGLLGRPIDAALSWEPALLAAPLGPCDLRETFHRATLRGNQVTPVAFQESHAQRALAEANALVRQPPSSPAVNIGEAVQVLPL